MGETRRASGGGVAPSSRPGSWALLAIGERQTRHALNSCARNLEGPTLESGALAGHGAARQNIVAKLGETTKAGAQRRRQAAMTRRSSACRHGPSHATRSAGAASKLKARNLFGRASARQWQMRGVEAAFPLSWNCGRQATGEILASLRRRRRLRPLVRAKGAHAGGEDREYSSTMASWHNRGGRDAWARTNEALDTNGS